ncbi:hypothetical protein RB195_017167 [Necator americanus]|uniref:Uncharacterized protein n=1 Tax=Necator americanus TaxID=51031 RepID=A0ABR1C6G7_NECAM
MCRQVIVSVSQSVSQLVGWLVFRGEEGADEEGGAWVHAGPIAALSLPACLAAAAAATAALFNRTRPRPFSTTRTPVLGSPPPSSPPPPLLLLFPLLLFPSSTRLVRPFPISLSLYASHPYIFRDHIR